MNTLATQSVRSLKDAFDVPPAWRKFFRLAVGSSILAAGGLVLIQRLFGN